MLSLEVTYICWIWKVPNLVIHNMFNSSLFFRYVTSQRHTIQVDYLTYMDEIAEVVGVQPSISRLLLTDPRLGLNLMFGPSTPYQYRLRGPRKWAGARQAILTQWERVAKPMQTRPCDEPKAKRSLKWPLILSAAAVGLAAYVNRNSLPAFLQDPTALLDRIKVYLPAQWCAINTQTLSAVIRLLF